MTELTTYEQITAVLCVLVTLAILRVLWTQRRRRPKPIEPFRFYDDGDE